MSKVKSIKEIEITEDLSIEDWYNQGKPIMWKTIEEKNGYKAQYDTGYGWMRLLKDNVELDRTRDGHAIVTDGCLMIYAEYFSGIKNLWF